MQKQTKISKGGGRRFSEKRQAALIYDIILAGGGTIGLRKLQILLYQCDFAAYRKHGKSLTGARYHKASHTTISKVDV